MSDNTILVFALLGGLCVGSFLNVVIHRLPRMMEARWRDDCFLLDHPDGPLPERPVYNLAVPRSACPNCGHLIRWYENIPVVSWIVLRGRCSNCRTAISRRYPLVELATGLLTVLVVHFLGTDWYTIAALLLTWSLVALTMIDYDTQLLPDDITLPLLWLGLLVSLADGGVTPTDAIIGAAAGYLTLWSVYQGFLLLTGKEGMGFGDFKLLAALGAWLGWQKLALVVVLSSAVGAALGIALILLLGRDRAQPMPFGPFLAIAGFLAFLCGDALLAGPLRLFSLG
ncbi:MAG: prepilin peptidase [Gammaproteobacteria bacterium]